MPLPDEGGGLSVDKYIVRVDAIPDDVYGLYCHHTTKHNWYKSLVRGDALEYDALLERAQAVGDKSFVKSIETGTQAAIRIEGVIEMVTLCLETFADEFCKSHTKLLEKIRTTARMTVHGETTLRFFKDHTQIFECRGAPGNMPLYTSYHTIHFPEGGMIDDPVGAFTHNNEMIRHFEETRTVQHFMDTGKKLKIALRRILEWIKDHNE